jgi:energy-coupling factor transport system ATP-binding protein
MVLSPFITVENLNYTYPRTQPTDLSALRDVSLHIEEGAYVAIVGANGSGKTTLARHLNALLIPTRGTVTIAGWDTRDPANHADIRQTVGMIFQRPENQIIASVVQEDVAFGLENLALPPETIRQRVRQALESVEMWQARHRPPRMLSAGQMQRVALAGILAMEPQCIIFDEATAMLDPLGREQVRATMRALHKRGKTVITITHRMEETLDADRIITMNAGQIAMDGTPREIFEHPTDLQELGLDLPPGAQLARILHDYVPAVPDHCMTAEEILDTLDTLQHRSRSGDTPFRQSAFQTVSEDPWIEVEALSHIYMKDTPLAQQSLNGATLTIGAGERHGLLGPTGAGKSTLLQHLNGLLKPQSGRVRIGSIDLGDPETDLQAIRSRIGLVFQLPEAQIFEQYVGDEIAYGPRLQGLRDDDLRSRVRWAMDQVGLDFDEDKDRYTFSLSGGQKRKVALASILALKPEALLLDEPTAGLDPRSSRELHHNLRTLNDAGMTLVLSSHRMEELAEMTEQLTVLAEGSTILHGTPSTVFAQGERLREIGLDQPLVAKLAAELYARKWPVPQGLTDPEALSQHVAAAVNL